MTGLSRETLILLYGPTGVGKTGLSLWLSEHLGEIPIVSCDSRQFYREMRVGTAMPTEEQLNRAKHYFIANRSVTEPYSCGQYEQEVIPLLEKLFEEFPYVLMVGGSMLYIDAVCDGIADIPTILPEVREEVAVVYRERGIDYVRSQLKLVDPEYYGRVDLMNAKRMVHALEVYLQTSRPFSSFHGGGAKRRSFDILKVELQLPREELYERINARVDGMMCDGLLEEVRNLLPYRRENALNTVGYKEIFRYLDGEWELDFAVEKIKANTRNYAMVSSLYGCSPFQSIGWRWGFGIGKADL